MDRRFKDVLGMRARSRISAALVLACVVLVGTLTPARLALAEPDNAVDNPALDTAAVDTTADARSFAQTGYRIDRDTFWDYFSHRGGTTTFGYPVSRDFLFEGCISQFFQRAVLQQCGTNGVGLLNLLDDGLLPYTRMNGSTFPGSDLKITSAAPTPSSLTYATDIVTFVSAKAPDTFDGLPVNFRKTFFGTISPDLGGTDDPAILALLDLEIWGAPTSAPAYDPSNHNFVYQRFQRGVMHYDRNCGCTQGMLLADYLKAVLTGINLPVDLDAQAGKSVLLRAATNGHPPIATTFGNAFQPGAGSVTADNPTAVALKALPSTSGTAAPHTATSPELGLSMFLWGNPGTTDRDLKIATGSSARWQKTLFQWRLIEGACKGCFDWSEADRVVKSSAANGVKIIARVDFQPDWSRRDQVRNGPPDNYADYADFVSALTARYAPGSSIGTVDAIEVWNEVNIDREWGNQAINQQQAADYVRFLGQAYRAAHAARPDIIIVTAGLSPTGVHSASAWDDQEYLQWLFDAGLKGGVNYDVLGAHGNTQAPEVDAPPGSLPNFGHPSFYFRRVEGLRDVQVRAGDADRQVWLLEFGWTADTLHPNYAWFAVSETKKADNVVKALQFARKNWSPWIGVMTLWTLSDPSWTPDREEYWWAISNPDGSARPALTAVRTARSTGAI